MLLLMLVFLKFIKIHSEPLSGSLGRVFDSDSTLTVPLSSPGLAEIALGESRCSSNGLAYHPRGNRNTVLPALGYKN